MQQFFNVITEMLPLWAIIFMIVYIIYAVFRTWYIFKETMDDGFFTGLYDVYIDKAKPIYDPPQHEPLEQGKQRKLVGYEPAALKLYHIIWAIIDIPCICIGACLPFIRKVFAFKIATVRRPTEEATD